MSLGRRKKNSTSLARSSTVRSRDSCRCRYPASRSISAAGSLSVPLLGTATFNITELLLGSPRSGGAGVDQRLVPGVVDQSRYAASGGWVGGRIAPGARPGPLEMPIHLLEADPSPDHDH